MTNTLFDHVYMINLDDQVERYESAKAECEKHNIVFERISAIKGSDSLPFNGVPSEGWNTNAAGLCMTTINIIEDAKAKGYKKILILEDDVRFLSNYDMLISNLKGAPEDWEFLNLASNHKIMPTYYAQGLYTLSGAICCQAYGVSDKMYDVYLAELRKYAKPIDEVAAELHKRGKSYCSIVNLVYHEKNKYSTLREKIVNY